MRCFCLLLALLPTSHSRVSPAQESFAAEVAARRKRRLFRTAEQDKKAIEFEMPGNFMSRIVRKSLGPHGYSRSVRAQKTRHQSLNFISYSVQNQIYRYLVYPATGMNYYD